MASDLAIPARLVAAGVGLPAVFRCTDHETCMSGWGADDSFITCEVNPGGGPFRVFALDFDSALDLSDPQTAFGCALKLDEWERARVPMWPDSHTGQGFGMSWAAWVADESANPVTLRDLIARLTRIGMDHEIRRALGWTVEPGTLATLECVGGDPDGQWCWQVRYDGRFRGFADGPNWAGADVQLPPGSFAAPDPDKALAAIWQEVAP